MHHDAQQSVLIPAGESPSLLPAADAESPADAPSAPSRRQLLARGGRLLAYSAPLVLLYKPRAAFATFIPYSGG